MYTKEFESKTEAMAYEKWLKTGASRDFIKRYRIDIGFISAPADASSSLLPGTRQEFSEVC